MTKVSTPHQVADALNVHYRTVLDWIASGELGYVLLGNPNAKRPKYGVTDEQLDAFLDARSRS